MADIKEERLRFVFDDIIEDDIDTLVEDPDNTRVHDQRNLAAIRGSLGEFGSVVPLVVQKGSRRIIAGNGTWEAMRDMGFERVRFVEIECTDEEARMLSISLNRTAELADWNLEQLSHEMQNLDFDFTALGWEDYELDPLLRADWEPPPIVDDPPPMGDPAEGAAVLRELPTLDETQTQTVLAAVAKRVAEESGEVTDATALALICAQYLDAE